MTDVNHPSYATAKISTKFKKNIKPMKSRNLTKEYNVSTVFDISTTSETINQKVCAKYVLIARYEKRVKSVLYSGRTKTFLKITPNISTVR